MKPAIMFVPLLWIGATAQVRFQGKSIPPGEQTGKASIEGSVLDAITRQPVKKASVMLSGRIGLSAVTDASGHFAFRQLPAGQYTILAQSDKYSPIQGPLDTGKQLTVSLAAEEHKQDISLSLTPGASVRGHIVDEDANPMSRCNIFAMQFRDMGTGRGLQQLGSYQSDDQGEYRISNLPSGKYYLQARCHQTLPLPHAFLPRTSAVDVPTLIYPPLYYPGAADLAGAGKVEASPGADIAGIDFRMVPARGVTVRGHVNSAPDRNMQLTLTPKDAPDRVMRTLGARVNLETGEFHIPNVLPGSYEMVAIASAEGRVYFGKVSVEVGAAPPDPIDLVLAAAPAISGTISIEGDPPKTQTNHLQIMMNPIEVQPMMGPQPQTQVQSDGTFILNSVMPGRWRLFVNGAPGYVKSVMQGDREVSPWDLDIGSSAVQLKIVIGTTYSRMELELSAPAAGNEPVTAILWPANGDPSFQQNANISPNPSSISIPPGRYFACAVSTAQPWMLMQNGALRKALESRCETVEAPEAGKVRVQLPLIPAADLKQLLDKIDQ